MAKPFAVTENDFRRQGVVFVFEERHWMGTITEQLSFYEGKQVRFVNLKLRNDSFIYTSATAAPPTTKRAEEAEKLLLALYLRCAVSERCPKSLRLLSTTLQRVSELTCTFGARTVCNATQ
jgi:hypothetical protein